LPKQQTGLRNFSGLKGPGRLTGKGSSPFPVFCFFGR
jgi:hypothetical protein